MTVPKKYGPVRKIGIQTRSITGTMPSGNRYESALERDVMELLRAEPDFERFDSQPVTVKYQFDGEHNYTLDGLVFWRSERRPILIEVKYRKDFAGQWRDYRAKFRAASNYAKWQGWEFSVFTEEIRTPKLSNIRFLHDYKNYPVAGDIDAAILRRLKRGATAARTVVQEVANRRIEPAEVVSALWRLVAVGKVGTDLNAPLTMSSVISFTK